MGLRRKVLNQCRAKTVNDKVLTGPILSLLAEQFVGDINSGAIPNIDSSWNNVC